MQRKSAAWLQVHNHRIRMKVACKDAFMDLADPSLTDSIHLFPGALLYSSA